MILGWRGIVDRDGDVIAWPTVLMQHSDAFSALPSMVSRNYRARWRQWDGEPGARIDFDPGASQEDSAKVQAWVDAAQGVTHGSKTGRFNCAAPNLNRVVSVSRCGLCDDGTYRHECGHA